MFSLPFGERKRFLPTVCGPPHGMTALRLSTQADPFYPMILSLIDELNVLSPLRGEKTLFANGLLAAAWGDAYQ